jgi:hypothetical protein
MASDSKSLKSEPLDTVVYRMTVPRDIWEKFKEQTPRTISMNDHLLILVCKDLGIEYPKSTESSNKKKSNR